MSQDSGIWTNATSVTSGTSSQSQQISDDLMNIYFEHNVEDIAKDAGIIEVEVSTESSLKTNIQMVQQNQNTNKLIKIIKVNPALNPPVISLNSQTPDTPARIPLNIAKYKSPITLTPSRSLEQANSSTLIQYIANNTPLKPFTLTNFTTPTHKRLYEDRDSIEALRLDPMACGDSCKRRKGSAHGGKGLRHFSMKVCEKVKQKGNTTYNEVADELVMEFADSIEPQDIYDQTQSFDQKNIRRRVYDALNVLMAMNIISKEKKEIRWIGLPTNSMEEHRNLELQKKALLARIQNKNRELNDLIIQQIAYKNLVERNKERERQFGPPSHNVYIKLPFVLINTNKKTIIDCNISSDKCEYLFNFDQAFEIHDDIDVLKRMGLAFGLEMGQCEPENLEIAISMIPSNLRHLVKAMVKDSCDTHIKTELPFNISDDSISEEIVWDAILDPSQQSSSYCPSEPLSPSGCSDQDSEEEQ